MPTVAELMSANGNVGDVELIKRMIYSIKDIGKAKGDGVHDDSSSLQKTIDYAVARGGGTVAFPPGTYKISQNLTVPSNITVWFVDGAKLAPDSGITVTINGPVQAELYQIFSGLGTIAGTPQIHESFPEWFGAKRDGINDDAPAIQKAVDFLSVGGQVSLSEGTYRTNSSITVIKVIRFWGCGVNTVINYTGTDKAIKVIKTGSSMLNSEQQLYGVVIGGFYLKGNARGQRAKGLYMEKVDHFVIKDMYIEQFKGTGIELSKCREGDFYSVHTRFNGYMDATTDEPDLFISSPAAIQGDRTNEINFHNCFFIFGFSSLCIVDASDRVRFTDCMFHNQVPEATPGAGPGLKTIITNLFGAAEYPDPNIYKNNSLIRVQNAAKYVWIQGGTYTTCGKKMFDVQVGSLNVLGALTGGFYDWTAGTKNYIIAASNGAKVKFVNNNVGDCSEPFLVDGTSSVRWYANTIETQALEQSLMGADTIDVYSDMQLKENTLTARTLKALELKARSATEPISIHALADLTVPFRLKSLNPTTKVLEDTAMIVNGDWEYLNNMKMSAVKAVFHKSRSPGEQMVIDLSDSTIAQPLNIKTVDEAGNKKSSVFVEGGATQSRSLMVGNQDVDFSLNISKSGVPRAPREGDIFWDTTVKALKIYNGTIWKTATLT